MNRREITQIVAASGLAASFRSSAWGQSVAPVQQHRSSNSSFVTVRDGTELFVQDWGEGRPVLFLSPWALNSDIWGTHMAALNARGMRSIALDRLGHGRSSIPSKGYDLNTLSDHIAAVVDQRGLRDLVLVAYSMASLEAARYYTRHGSSRVSKLVLAAPVPPSLTKSSDNPEGAAPALLEMQHQLIARDYPKWIGENEAPFFTPETDSETRRWIKDMMLRVPLPAALACLRMAASADVRTDLKRITCPTLIVHGDKDASAPIAVTREKTARLIAGSRFLVYSGAPHGLVLTHRERFLADLLGFIET